MTIPNTFTNGTNANATEVNENFAYCDKDIGLLGEVRMFALSMTGAVTKASLQAKGWAICDGTTPATQGISGATITSTPDLQEKFLRMSNDETSGTTGGTTDHNHKWLNTSIVLNNTFNSAGATKSALVGDEGGAYSTGTNWLSAGNTADGWNYTDKVDNLPPFYEVVYFMKVKV